MSEHDELGFELPAPVKASRARVLVIVVAVVGVAFAARYLQNRAARGDTPVVAAQTGPVRVEVTKPATQTTDHALALPGSVRPFLEAKLFPRVTGYVRRRTVELGADVKEGQVLAEIDTPDLDAQIAQARAQIAQAKASVQQAIAQRDVANQSSARYRTLADQQLVSKSQVEQTEATAATNEGVLAAAQSTVTSQEANLRRMLDLKNFATFVAPFAGTITSFTAERGSLVNEGDSMAGQPMFTLAQLDPVKVAIDVPQSVAPAIKEDLDATLTVREFPGRTFAAKVKYISHSLDPGLHVMQVVIVASNADRALLPGMYVQVAITLPVPHRVLEIPSTALYNDAQGMRVAIVDAQQKIHFAPITLERDTGATLWIATGLTGEERILKIAIPTLSEGDAVEIARSPAAGSSR